ncbi:MAG: methionine adenosyltransferase domain-containing protein, partial [Alphaproteobacteria bacterium]
GLADKCEIHIAYAIGTAEPISLNIETYGTGKIPNKFLLELVRQIFDLRPYGIIKMLSLDSPIYKQTAAYGHFGREDIDLSWEKTDKADSLRMLSNI